MPGPPPDPTGRRAAEGRATVKASIDIEVLPAVQPGQGPPAPPDGLPTELVAEWEDFWEQPVARAVAESDLPALRRLFAYRARLLQALSHVPPSGLDIGGDGQDVVHPGLRVVTALEKLIAPLEDRFGLTMKARQVMGIRMGQLAEIARKAAADPPTSHAARPDPRLTTPTVTAVTGAPACRARGCDAPADPGSPRRRCHEHRWCAHCSDGEVVTGRWCPPCQSHRRRHGELPSQEVIDARRRR